MYILYFLLHLLKVILLIHVHAFVLHGGVAVVNAVVNAFLMIHDVLSCVIVSSFCFFFCFLLECA